LVNGHVTVNSSVLQIPQRELTLLGLDALAKVKAELIRVAVACDKLVELL
jgi:hypothetical protein